MGKKYKIVYLRKDCIGAGACEFAAPDFWKLDTEVNIATIIHPAAIKTKDREELIIDEKDLEKNYEAAENCPVRVIEIYELETGKKIYPKE